MQNSPRRSPALWLMVALVGCGLALTSLLMIVLPFVLPVAFFGSYAAVLVGIGLITFMLGIGLLVSRSKGLARQDHPCPFLHGGDGWSCC